MMKFCIIGFIWDHMCIKEFLGAFEQGSSSSVHLGRDLVFWTLFAGWPRCSSKFERPCQPCVSNGLARGLNIPKVPGY